MKVTYYIAICVFLACLVTIVVKMTFWPVCTVITTGSATGSTTCDGWTIAGLTAAILGIAAAFLGILGAILLAAWWTGLDERVKKQVTEAFKTQVQTLQSGVEQTKEQLRKVQADMAQLNTQATSLQEATNKLSQKTDQVRQETSRLFPEEKFKAIFEEHRQMTKQEDQTE